MGDIEKLARIGENKIISNILEQIDTIKLYFGNYKYVNALGGNCIFNSINRYREARKEAINCGIDVKEFDSIVSNITLGVNKIPLFKEAYFDHYTRMSLILDERKKELN